MLPVYDLASRGQAQNELEEYGLSRDSLEQKCARQINNVELSDEKLAEQIALWERAIKATTSVLHLVEINTLEIKTIGEL